MKKKSSNYSSADSGGWMNVCDDLFMSQFRGSPCSVCGERRGFYGGRTIRSMAHHLLEKGLHREHRYNPDNIIILCPKHHMGGQMSPHSHDGAAIKAFYEWLEREHPEKSKFMDDHRLDKHTGWRYRDKYVELSGRIGTKTGLLKDLRPIGHAKKVEQVEDNR